MHWILQDNLFNEAAYQTLIETLQRFKIPHSSHKVVPFVGELLPNATLPTTNVICMGSYSLRHIAKAKQWYPGVFDLEPLDFTVQLSKWGTHMLNAEATVFPFGECEFREEEMFIRPIQDSKVFAGKVIDRQTFLQWKKRVCDLKLDCGDSLTATTLVQTCPIKKIYSEHRFWIVRGVVVTSSTYKLGARVHYQPLIDARFEEYAYARIAEWQPAAAFVIDVADTADGLKVIEINTLNSCGFYACDIQKLVRALEDNFNQE